MPKEYKIMYKMAMEIKFYDNYNQDAMYMTANKIKQEINLDGIKWGDHQLVLQGIKSYKLQINCVFQEDKINIDDDIIDKINSWEDQIETCEITLLQQI